MIYADNAATTRISDIVFEKMLPFLREQYGNASSPYSLGAKAKRAIEQARKQVAASIGAEPPEIIFTSGGSEANSWVLRCVAETYRNEPMHIITSAIEHHSVLNACHSLEQRGVEVTYLPVDASGKVSTGNVKAATKSHTRLVSIMLANNEIGTVQPIAEIGRLLKGEGILFHTDAVQAVGHIPVDVNDLQVDFLTASAHKFNGAKGTGILYKRSASGLLPLVFGGEQEHGLRAGTENVAGIVAAGYAIEESVNEMADTAKRLKAMVEDTVIGIKEKIPSVRVNGDSECRLPGTVNLCFDGVSGETLMHLLDLKGVCLSTSSACTSGKDEPSHVLLALGLTEQQAKSSIRISYGKYNCADEVGKIVTAVCDAYEKIVENR
ncbi:MAG: cysteine desulfurase [Deltaproteobacteria bacterium]|nr:cysteine desulfurase [Deltaproteobacteria bacterium]